MKVCYWLMLTFLVTATQPLLAQDSVDITFRYTRAGVSGVTLPGEFNGWSNTAWPMTSQGNNLWTRTARLRVGGNPNPPSVGVPGAWQYKFYYSGAGDWPNDPLEHHVNPADNNNSFLYTKDPTIYQFLPNHRQPVVSTWTPTITAYIFPKVGASVDTSTLRLQIDGTVRQGLGTYFDNTSHLLSFPWPSPLANGSHVAILVAGSTAGGSNADTVTFTTQAGYIQITTHGGYPTWNRIRPIRGIIQNTAASSVKLVRNGVDTAVVPVTAGAFAFTDTLTEGANTFQALADSSGGVAVSNPVTFTYLVNHAPTAAISFSDPSSGTMTMLATESSDPDPGQSSTLTFAWSEDPGNPAVLGGINGATSSGVTVTVPSTPGEYYVNLIARDVDGKADTTRSYFIVSAGRSVTFPTLRSNPAWAKEGRIYFLFPKAFSAAGTISEAAKRLQYIKDMGFSIIWMMPVMDNNAPIDQGYNPGYNIVDFYTVAPEYGTNQDFKSFVSQVHALGLKVILDVTPNHTSRFHPWSLDAHQFKQDSRYWTWYEHAMTTSNTNGLGDCLDADGFNYYCGFSDQLLNFNWTDPDARTEMINVYKYWIREFGVDGYRFDVYWGPHRRYGETYMGLPVRTALKHIKPDILLLGEDDGTGSGTETIYADYTGSVPGGLDASYDFKLYFNQIRGFGFTASAINTLHSEIDNNGFYPGKDALYMRFMESQDEDRIVWFYSNSFALDATTTFMRTMPMATVLFTAPGLPMLWNGQEVGWGYGIGGQKEARNRSTINWDYQGKTLLSPHYQKLALIRGQFPAFTQHKRDTNLDGSVTSADSSDFIRCGSTNGLVYAFTRPYANQNGLTTVNFSGTEQTTQLNLLVPQGLAFSGGLQPTASYYLNDLYTNSSTQVTGSNLGAVAVTLPAYGSAVYTVSTTRDTLRISNPVLSVPRDGTRPLEYGLEQNYPNPFNPSTIIKYTVGGARDQGPGIRKISLVVYDVLGRQVATLVGEAKAPGTYETKFDGARLPSGVYFYRLTAGDFVQTRKMILVK